MPLSRLENFIKNVEGNILYVNPNDQDATDSISNQGNSLTRPFKTIQRALIEAARFSYVVGKDNDKFDKTTILVYPGIHKIDNRPGYSIHNNSGTAEYKNRFGAVVASSELTSSSNFDIEDPLNVLYQFNSTNGGVIIPRGTSLVGMDLRKTKIYPMFVPDPQNSEIDATAIFRVTGGCYFWQFSLFDGEPNSNVYKNYTTTRFAPNFSHHKLTCFEYADGNNTISLGAVTGGTAVTSTLTDLDTFYNKIANAYGPSSGREIPSWPANEFIQPKLAENEIVGAIQADPIGITSVFSTNSPNYVETGAVGPNVVVTTSTPHNLNVGTPILVSGITTSAVATTQDPIFNADGGAVVAEVLSDNQFAFTASSSTSVAYPHLSGDENVQVEPDTVTGCSPYIFNCSLRSVYGMNGLHADGAKATGFKSMVLAQFTGIGLNKDDNAFLIYNTTTGSYNDTTTAAESEKPLHINSSAVFKPQYENTHVKVSNSAILQCVSIFAIGFANHFVAETGGDQSITNSNSNFGAKSLIARKFRTSAFQRDNSGYVTHIIPPKQDTKIDESFFWVPLDVGLTTNYYVGSGTSDRLYTFGYSDIDAPPTHIIDSFRIGARESEVIKLEVNNNTQSANVLMEGSNTATFEKNVNVSRNATGTANSITESSGSIFYLDNNHELSEGESIRILSDDGTFPDGVDENTVYYTITDGLPDNQIKIAKTLNESLSGNVNPVENVNTIGGKLKVVSRVSDKLPGDPGHPLQFDTTVGDTGNWYLRVEAASSNTIYDSIKDIDRVVTSKTFISRKSDSRNLIDRLYKVRYVIPREYQDAKPPTPGYVFQESSTSIVASNSEYTSDISNTTDFRNVKILHNLDFDGTTGVTTVTSETPHKLKSGSIVKINNVKSSNNTTASANVGFNGSYSVDTVIDSKTFEINVPISNNPGTFLPERPASASSRNENTPNFSINEYAETYYVYRVETIKEYEEGTQDGIYHLICLLGSVNPTSSYFNDIGFSQNVVNLYPQIDRDNYTIDPKPSISVAKNYPVSKVITDDLRNSITKEFVNSFLVDNRLGFNVVDAKYDYATGIATFTSDIEHNFDNVINVSVADSGSGYGYAGLTTTLYNAKLVGGTGDGATVTFVSQSGGDHNLESPTIVDGGSGYTVGDTLAVSAVGINTFSAGGVIYTPASLSVTGVNQARNNSLQIENVIDYGVGDAFNGVYKIIDVPSSTEVSVQLPPGLSGVGTYKKLGTFTVAGSASTITSLQYTDVTTGIVTVTTDRAHGLSLGNSFKLDWNEESNSVTSIYNGTFTVNERIGINTFTFFIGDSVSIESVPSSVGKVLPTGYSAQEFDTGAIENIEKRMNSFYAGITTSTNAQITKSSTSITLVSSIGFGKGDYLQVGPEIVRVKTNFSSNQAQIIRGVFGTRVSTIPSGTLAKKITPIPVEGRRYSILRASGHTFEYVGFGPGNYSTALPQRQDRVLTQDEQLLSQAERSDGGVVVYTGMNDTGDFYVGNKRFSATTGEEETINIPIITYVGDPGDDSRLSLVVDDITVKEFIKVEGGAGGVIQSEFNGPVLFTEKINVTSDKGADFKFITLKGTETNTTRRRYTVGLGTPAESGDYSVGDIVFKNDPEPGGYLGWVYAGEEGTEDNSWRKFGLIATERANDGNFPDSNNESPLGNFTILPSKIGINTNIPADIIDVQAGTTKLDRLYVAGIATFNSPVQLGQVTLDNLIVNQSLNVSGKFQANTPLGFGVTGNVTICGMTTIHDSLTVSGDTSISGALTVSGHTDLNRSLQVSGNASVGGNFDATGNTDLGGALQVSGNTSIAGSLQVNGNTSVGGALNVSGHTNLNRSLQVSGHTSMKGRLDVTDTTSLHGGLTVSGGTSLHGGLAVRGFAEFHDDIFISGNTLHTGRLMVSGDAFVNVNSGVTTVGGDLYVCGRFDLGNDLTVSGNTTICGDTHIEGTTSIGGDLNVSGNASIGRGLHVSGDTTLSGALTVSGHTNLNRSLQVSANTSVGKNLTVTGNTDLGGSLQVSGATSLKGGVTVCGGMQVHGLADFKDDIIISGNTLYTGRLMVSGDSFLNVTSGITTIGGALTVSGHTNLNRNLQVSGNTSIKGSLQVNSNTSVGGVLVVSGNANLNKQLQVSGNVSVGGQTQIKGNTSVGGQLNVNGSIITNGGLTVCGGAILHDDLTVSGDTQLTGDLAAKNLSTGGYLYVSGNAQICGTICVGDNAVFRDDVTICGDGKLKVIGKSGHIEVVDTQFNQPRLTFKGLCGQVERTRGYIEPSEGSQVSTAAKGLSIFTGGSHTTAFTVCEDHTIKVPDPDSSNYPDPVFRIEGTTGTTSVAGALHVSGHTNLNGALQVSGNTSIKGNLQVNGTTSIGGNLKVDLGLATIKNIRATNALQVQGNTSITGNLQVQGSTCLVADVQAKGNLSVGSALIVSASIASESLQVTGNISSGASVFVSSGVIIEGEGNTRIELKSSNGGQPYIDFGNSTSGTTSSDYDARLVLANDNLLKLDGANFMVSGNLTVNNNLIVSGNTTISGDLTVSGAAIFKESITGQGTLTISGHTDLNRSLQVSGSTSIGGGLLVSGNSQLQGNATVSKALLLRSELDFIGAGNKYMDFMLISSNNSRFSGHIRSINHQSQQANIHLRWKRSEGVYLYYNQTTRAETTNTGFYVCGTISALQDIKVGGQLRAGGSVSVAESGHIGGSLQVSGTISAGTLVVTGLTQTNNFRADGALQVQGSTCMVGSIQAKGTLSVGGQLNINQNADINGTLDVQGDTIIQSSLTVKDDLTLSGDLIGPTNWIVPGYATVSKYLNVRQNIATSGNLLVGYGEAAYTGTTPNPAQQFNTGGSNHAAIYFPKASSSPTNAGQFNTAIAVNVDGANKARLGFWMKGSRVFNMHEDRIVSDVQHYAEGNLVVGENSATGGDTQGVLYARAGGASRSHVGLQVTNKIRNTGNVEIGVGVGGWPSIYADDATLVLSSPKGGNQEGHVYIARSKEAAGQGDYYFAAVAKKQGQESQGITVLKGPFDQTFELKRADNGLSPWGTHVVAVANKHFIGGFQGFYFPNAGQVQGSAVNVEAYNVAGSGHYNLRISGSSRRIKTDISDFTIDTDKVLQLRPVIYKELDKEVIRNTSAKVESVRRFVNPDAEPRLGLIAEEVYELIPELTSVGILEDDLCLPEEERVKQPVDVRYQLISLAVLELSKKQQIEIDELKDKIAALEDELHNKLDEKLKTYDELYASLSKLLTAESQKNVELKSQLLELTQRITDLENN